MVVIRILGVLKGSGIVRIRILRVLKGIRKMSARISSMCSIGSV